jgi:uncharacterized OB-fold protein
MSRVSSSEAEDRPRPSFDRDTEFFWIGIGSGEILVQRCAACGSLRHPPRPACPQCRSFEWTANPVSGSGEVYSFAIQHHPPTPGFQLPFVVVLVQLAEGVRLVANLVDCELERVRIGLPVQASCVEVEPGLWLPQFRPAERS